jgi:hypothetical protein
MRFRRVGIFNNQQIAHDTLAQRFPGGKGIGVIVTAVGRQQETFAFVVVSYTTRDMAGTAKVHMRPNSGIEESFRTLERSTAIIAATTPIAGITSSTRCATGIVTFAACQQQGSKQANEQIFV